MRTGMELNALKIFIAVVENSSFVGASKTLQIPTSNVSR
ncbi:MAG: LysR family transcriptional regulator, partial [Plesiomonas shigelloides]